MNLLILGATGKVGRLVLAQALKQGHDVTALVRSPGKIPLALREHPRLIVRTGSAAGPTAVADAMAGRDAVISALGHNSLAPSSIQTDATRAVLAAIQPGQRVVSLTGQGVSDPLDPPPTLGSRLVTAIIKLVPGRMYADGVEHARLLRESTASWVLVRSPAMTGGAPTAYRTGYLRLGLFDTARRADVANFILACAQTDAWLRKAPMIASAK